VVERERDGEEGGEVMLARSGGEARNEAKQLFHRKAGIESQSPVVTLMRASVRAPEQEGPLVMAATAGVSPSHRIASSSGSGSGSGRDACSVIVLRVEVCGWDCIVYSGSSGSMIRYRCIID